MTAEHYFLTGGDCTILLTEPDTAAAEPDAHEIQECDVNSLILSCRTSRESLCTLYNMFKKNVFAILFKRYLLRMDY